MSVAGIKQHFESFKGWLRQPPNEYRQLPLTCHDTLKEGLYVGAGVAAGVSAPITAGIVTVATVASVYADRTNFISFSNKFYFSGCSAHYRTIKFLGGAAGGAVLKFFSPAVSGLVSTTLSFIAKNFLLSGPDKGNFNNPFQVRVIITSGGALLGALVGGAPGAVLGGAFTGYMIGKEIKPPVAEKDDKVKEKK